MEECQFDQVLHFFASEGEYPWIGLITVVYCVSEPL